MELSPQTNPGKSTKIQLNLIRLFNLISRNVLLLLTASSVPTSLGLWGASKRRRSVGCSSRVVFVSFQLQCGVTKVYGVDKKLASCDGSIVGGGVSLLFIVHPPPINASPRRVAGGKFDFPLRRLQITLRALLAMPLWPGGVEGVGDLMLIMILVISTKRCHNFSQHCSSSIIDCFPSHSEKTKQQRSIDPVSPCFSRAHWWCVLALEKSLAVASRLQERHRVAAIGHGRSESSNE